MIYPDYMTQQEIMEFEYDLNKIIDIERGEGFWLQNAECQIVAQEQQEAELAQRSVDMFFV